MLNEAKVKFLKKQYKDGPVVNTSSTKTPYLDYLNADLTKQRKNLEKTVDEMNTKYTLWVRPNPPPPFFLYSTCYY